MSNLKDYFEKHCYKPKYFIGDRIFGKYNKVPFIGTVGNDTLISEQEGPYVIVHLDLPILDKGKYLSIIKVKHKDIKSYLRNFDEKMAS